MFVLHQKDIDRVPNFSVNSGPGPGNSGPGLEKFGTRTLKFGTRTLTKFGTRHLNSGPGPWKIWDPDPEKFGIRHLENMGSETRYFGSKKWDCFVLPLEGI